MRSAVIPSLCLAFVLARSAKAQVQTQVDGMEDRQPGNFKVKIKLTGSVVFDAYSTQVDVTKAVDDCGRDLIDPQKENDAFKNSHLVENSGFTDVSLNLKSPARTATLIRELSGEARLFVPKNDPDSTVKVERFESRAGKPVVSRVLSAAGIEITVYTKEQREAAAEGHIFHANIPYGPNDITLHIKDPRQKLVNIEFQDVGGSKIKGTGWEAHGEIDDQTKTFLFDSQLPATALLVIYLSTPKAFVTVPFAFTNVRLP